MNDNADTHPESTVVSIFDRVPVNNTVENEGRDKDRQQAIEALEDILEQFKRGEWDGFAIVAVNEGNETTMTGQSAALWTMPFIYLGAMDRLRHRIHRNLDYYDETEE